MAAFVCSTALFRKNSNCIQSKRGRWNRPLYMVASSGYGTTTTYSREDNWQGLVKSSGLWEGNVTNYDKDGNETSRLPDSLYIFPEEISPREDGLPGPGTVWVQLQRPGKRNATQVFFSHEDIVTRGMVLSPLADMDCAFKSVSRAGGAYFEQMCAGWNSNNEYFGRVRVVHSAYRGSGEFAAWTVFRERRATDALPAYYSELPDLRVPPAEVSETNHPWLDKKKNSSESAFEQMAGNWTVQMTKLEAKNLGKTEISFPGSISFNGSNLVASYNLSQSQTFEFEGQLVTNKLVQFSDGMEMRDLGGGVTVLTPSEIPADGRPFSVECAWILGDYRRRVSRRYVDAMSLLGDMRAFALALNQCLSLLRF